MAEEAAKSSDQEGTDRKAAAKSSGGNLFLVLAVVNMLIVVGVGVVFYLNNKKNEKNNGIEDVLEAEKLKLEEERKSKDYIGPLIPLETFLVNLSGSRGRKLAKVNIELEVNNGAVQEEIDQLKPKIRDMIIIILSSKTYAQVSEKEGKDTLRDEIKDQVNLFLTKGQILSVYFTEFIFN